MSGNFSHLELTDESRSRLLTAGFSEMQTEAVADDILAANTIVATKNRAVLHELPYNDLRHNPELLAAYERLDDGKSTIEDAILLMRRTKLASAMLTRTVSVDALEEDRFNEIEQYVSTSTRFGRISDILEQAPSGVPKLKTVHSPKLGQAGITSYVAKESVGTLEGLSDINIIRRYTFAGINSPREVDVKALLGWQERHPNDHRDAVVVPISTTHIAHR